MATGSIDVIAALLVAKQIGQLLGSPLTTPIATIQFILAPACAGLFDSAGIKVLVLPNDVLLCAWLPCPSGQGAHLPGLG